MIVEKIPGRAKFGRPDRWSARWPGEHKSKAEVGNSEEEAKRKLRARSQWIKLWAFGEMARKKPSQSNWWETAGPLWCAVIAWGTLVTLHGSTIRGIHIP